MSRLINDCNYKQIFIYEISKKDNSEKEKN